MAASLGPISGKNHPELKTATSTRAASFPAFQSGHRHWRASSLGPNKIRGKKVGQWNRAPGKVVGQKVAVRSTLGPPASSFWQFPATSNEKTPGLLFFCFRSESGFGVSSSSSAQPFCSGILKPNAGKDKDSPTPCLGGGADFSLKWVLEVPRDPGGFRN